MDRDQAKQLEIDVRRLLAESGSADALFERINDGIASSDDPGAVGLLLLSRAVAQQWSPEPAAVADDALTAASLLREAGEPDAAVFAEAAGGAMLLRAGEIDAAADIAVRTLAAIERMTVTEEWGSRTANCVGLIFYELHAFELAARSSSRSLEWSGARDDPPTRVMIDGIRGYYAVRAAEAHPAGSSSREECIEMARSIVETLADLDDLPTAIVTRSCIESEIEFLTGGHPDPDELEMVGRHYDTCATQWLGWHQLIHGRALNADGRHEEAMAALNRSLENRWSFGEEAARRELSRSLAALGRAEEALAELHNVLEQLDSFVHNHVARQATALAERVDVEKHTASLRERSEQLANQIAEDHLTGVASRRALDEFLDQPVDSVSANAALVCDLDRFKLINDCYGHATGDDVLTEVGRIFREQARADDFVGRFGGEEFVVIMRRATPGAADAAERIRMAIESAPWHTVADDLHVTVSIGVAAGLAPLRDLLRAADIAVYDAKNAGRNQVCVADDGTATLRTAFPA